MYKAFTIILFLISSTLFAQSIEEFEKQSNETKKVAKEYIDIYFSFDHDKVKKYYTDETVWFDPTGEVAFGGKKQIGTEAIIKNFESWGDLGPADFKIKHEFFFEKFAVMSGFLTYSWTSAEGKTFHYKELPLTVTLKIIDGKVLEHLDYGDYLVVFKQSREQSN